jgi:hypothetical protein
MKFKVIFLGLLSGLLFVNKSLSQTLEFNDVLKVYLRSAGSIINGKEITGYYTFYKVEKVDKKNVAFKLIITDANLNKVAEKEIIDTKKTIITDAAFNGEYLAFKFLNGEEKDDGIQTIRIYDKNANEVSKVTSSYELKAYQTMALFSGNTDDDEIESSDLYGIPGVGFLNFTPVMTKGGMVGRCGINIKMVPQKGSAAKSWEYNTPEKIIETPVFLGYNDKMVFTGLVKREKASDKTFDFSTAGFDVNTGAKKFDKIFTDDKYTLDVLSSAFIPETGENYFFGLLMSKGEKTTKDDADGIFAAKVDNEGNILTKVNIPWDVFAKQFKPVDEKGKPVKIGNVYIHKIVKTADGKIFAIGERFRKAASGAGIAMAILAGGHTTSSVVKLVVEDMVIIEFSPDFKPVSVKFYDKGKSSVGLPAGAGMMGMAVLGMFAKATGGFDYAFTQEKADRSSFSVCYYSKLDKKNYFNSISYSDGNFTQDKISLETEATKQFVYPGKPGYVMIYEYFKKQKRISNRLEKINF